MSNRKYPRLADGYHDRSQYHPYQASSKFSSKSHSNCNSESGRERERSPVGSSITRGSSPYSRHSNFSPRSHRSKSYSRSRESNKRGSSKSPTDAHSHHTLTNSNSHGSERHSKPNHVNSDEAFVWSQHTSSSGKVYYYNCKTEKSQWEKPKDWIERERREKERKDKEKRDFAGSKDGRDIRGDPSLHREHLASSKPSKYMSPSKSIHRDYHSSGDKREGNHADIRNLSGEQKKDVQRLTESIDRGHQVVKTCSVHTTALPTVVNRPNPVVANFGGETAVSPAGSLQDVSPPTTPSSRPSIYDQAAHTPSPNVITAVSPQVPQHHGVPSPQLQFPQQSPPFPPRHRVPLAPNVFPQVSVTAAPRVTQQYPFAIHQYVVPQQAVQPVPPQMNDYRQYAHVNSTGPPLAQVSQQANAAPLPLAAQVPSPQQVVFNKQVSPQPVLHPLQQATLVLQQRKMSEAQAAAAASNIQQPYSIAATANALPPTTGLPQQAVSPVTVGLHRKDDRPHHSSPGSPVVFSQQPSLNEHTPHHSSQQLPSSLSAASSNLVSSSPISHSSNASSPVPVAQPSVPAVNLQAIAKYVDKNLTSHLSSWPTETVDRQVQKLWEESSCYSNDSDKAKIEQIQLQSEVGFMEMRLETASRRISSLKGMTRTLEALLAESDAKFLS